MQDLTERWLAEARQLGRDAGAAAGSWAADGNTSEEHARSVLNMLAQGDPMAFDYLPRYPNLSGEFADDPTPRSLVHELTGMYPTADDGELETAIADAWEEGVGETFESACEATLRASFPDIAR